VRKELRLLGVVFSLVLLSVVLFSNAAYCNPAADILIEEGKTLLFEERDVYAADAKFQQALSIDPAYERSNFWRALTVISSNPNLRTTLRNLEIMGEIGDGDPIEEFICFDKAGHNNYELTPVDNIIVDNSDAGYSEIGTWSQYTGEEEYGQDARIIAAGDGSSKAIWDVDIEIQGMYDVNVWWPGNIDGAPSVEYTVHYDGGSQTHIKYQSYTGGYWSYLGEFPFSGGPGERIELSDNASNGFVVADAVKLHYTGVRLDDSDAVFSGSWEVVSDGAAFGGSYTRIDPGLGGTCAWSHTFSESNQHELSVAWAPSENNAADALYEIYIDGFLMDSIPVNLQDEHLGEEVNLGLYSIGAGSTITVILHQSEDGQVTTDGIRLYSVRNMPTLSDLQGDLASLPFEINQALSYLGNISEAFQDQYDTGVEIIELDYGEVLALSAMLSALEFTVDLIAAYDLDDVNAPKLGLTYHKLITFDYLLETYENLGALDDPTALADAKQALIDGLNSYFAAFNFISNETDPQNDDLITLNPRDIENATSITNPRLQQLLENLQGLRPFVIVGNDVSDDIDPDEPYVRIPVDVSAFFDNPQSPRESLPGFDENENMLRNTWPDATFGGFLPQMTMAYLDGICSLGSDLYQPMLKWDLDSASVNLEWKEDTYSDFASYKIYRSTTSDVNEGSTLIYEGFEQDVTTAIDNDIDENERFYYYRLYTYYEDGDKIASHPREVITKIYVDINASGEIQDGSPQNPYRLLRDGIRASRYGTKVCVAEGIYQEGPDTIGLWDYDRGICLEGGYEGTNWTRDIDAHTTTIDGTNRGQWSVISIYYLNDVIVDGFTIISTEGPESGFDINYSQNIIIRNCDISNFEYRGIGIYYNSSVLVENCSVRDNGSFGISLHFNPSAVITSSVISGNGYEGVYVGETPVGGGPNTIISNCEISNNLDGIQLYFSYNRVIIKNNLIVDNTNQGIWFHGDDSPEMINNTVANNGSWGIGWTGDSRASELSTIYNNIIVGNSVGIYSDIDVNVNIDYNDVWGNPGSDYFSCTAGANDISADPLFVSGAYGDYYLSQITAGQAINSPCVDSGNSPANTIFPDGGLTTATNNNEDSGTVDMGYHYPIADSGNLAVVVINEFLPDPIGSDSGGEWVELYNPSGLSINLDGCWIDDIAGGGSAPVQIPQGSAIAAGGYFSLSMPGNGYFNNDGDTVSLYLPDGETIIDTYNYEQAIEGSSICRFPDGGEWSVYMDGTPTRDAPNDVKGVRISNLEGGEVVSGENFIIEAESSDPSDTSYMYILIDGRYYRYDRSAPYEFEWDTVRYANGSEHTLRLWSYFISTHEVVQSAPITVSVFNENPIVPSIEIVNPLPPEKSEIAGTVTVDINVTDLEGFSAIYLYCDSIHYLGYDRYDPVQINWDTTRFENGTHTLKAKGYHWALRSWVESEPVEIEVNNSNPDIPTIWITNPEEGTSLSGRVTIQVNTSHPDRMSLINFYIDETTMLPNDWRATPFQTKWPTEFFANGNHTIKVTSYFRGSSVKCEDSIMVNVYNEGPPPTPTVTIDSPQPGNLSGTGSYVPVEITLSDPLYMNNVRLNVNGELVDYDSYEPYDIDWPVRYYEDGNYTLEVRAYHRLTKNWHSDTVNVNLANGRPAFVPTFEIDSPVDGEEVSGLETITVASNDAYNFMWALFYVDDQYVGLDSRPPYAYNLNTENYSNGEHVMKVRSYHRPLRKYYEDEVSVVVQNGLLE